MAQGTARVDLTRSQSEGLLVQALIEHEFVVASWRGGEPIIYGTGQTKYQATNMARIACAPGRVPEEAELCTRFDPSNKYAWMGPSRRVITVEHFFTIDN